MTDSNPATQAPLRLKRLYVEELFGRQSPVIDVHFKLEDRVTILYGRNGAGKTITLELLHALQAGELEVLMRYPLRRLWLEMSDGSRLEFESVDVTVKKGGGKKRPPRKRLRYTIFNSHGGKEAEEELSGSLGDVVPEDVRRLLPWIRRVSEDVWIDRRSGRRIARGDLMQRYYETVLRERGVVDPRLPEAMRRRMVRESEEHLALVAALGRLPRSKFIKADRLFVRDPGGGLRDERHQLEFEFEEEGSARTRGGRMVEFLSWDIRELVAGADRRYRVTSTRLDSTLPTRLFTGHEDVPGLEELRERSKELRAQAERLQKLGLLRELPELVDEVSLTNAQKGTFYVILQDYEEKLAPLLQVVEKAERLLSSLNRKLAPKSVRLDVERGYQILNAVGEPLDLHCLSSGEQHELVLLHELLFDVSPGTLILIDEPELSLHVAWQRDVLPDLLEIAKLSELDFVLATHSPYIVGERADLMVRLGEPV